MSTIGQSKQHQDDHHDGEGLAPRYHDKQGAQDCHRDAHKEGSTVLIQDDTPYQAPYHCPGVLRDEHGRYRLDVGLGQQGQIEKTWSHTAQ